MILSPSVYVFTLPSNEIEERADLLSALKLKRDWSLEVVTRNFGLINFKLSVKLNALAIKSNFKLSLLPLPPILPFEMA